MEVNIFSQARTFEIRLISSIKPGTNYSALG